MLHDFNLYLFRILVHCVSKTTPSLIPPITCLVFFVSTLEFTFELAP
jgi:hypothetical protein